MKDPLAQYRDHPHLVVQGRRRNVRRPLILTDQPVSATFAIDEDVFVGPGLVDQAGRITLRGRQIVRRRTAATARSSRVRMCIVWSADACTWFDGDGRAIEGAKPPVGDMSDPWVGRRQDAAIEHCWTIVLPDRCRSSHLCLRHIYADLVEIAPGGPIVLVDFDERRAPGMPDPAEGMLSASLRLRAPETYRGSRVSGTAGWQILGPIQPSAGGRILRNPWPDDVREACVELAGMELPRRLTDAAWRAIDPQFRDVNQVGILRAA